MEANALKESGVYKACLGILKVCLRVVIVVLKILLQRKRNVPNLKTLIIPSNIPSTHNTNQTLG